MRAWLRSQGLWQIISGTEVKPTTPAITTSTAATTISDAEAAWNNRDDQAFGSLVLWISPAIRQRVALQTSSAAVWTLIATKYGVQSPSLLFMDFQQAISMQLSAANPAPKIAEMSEHFGCLTTGNVAIPAMVQAMILLAALPLEYDQLSATILNTTTTANLMFNNV